ncbi:hypothetical protein EV182_005907, partial [Spiromyces aspiralis]
ATKRVVLEQFGLKYVVFFEDTREAGETSSNVDVVKTEMSVSSLFSDIMYKLEDLKIVDDPIDSEDSVTADKDLSRAIKDTCMFADIIRENHKQVKYTIYKCTEYDLCFIEMIPNDSELQDINDLTPAQIEICRQVLDVAFPTQSHAATGTGTGTRDSDAMVVETSGAFDNPKGIILYETDNIKHEDIIYWTMLYNHTLPEEQRHHIFLLANDLVSNVMDDQELRGESKVANRYIKYFEEIINNALAKRASNGKRILVFVDTLLSLLDIGKDNFDKMLTIKLMSMLKVEGSPSMDEYERYTKGVLADMLVILTKFGAMSTVGQDIEIFPVIPMYLEDYVTKDEMLDTVNLLFKQRTQLFTEVQINAPAGLPTVLEGSSEMDIDSGKEKDLDRDNTVLSAKLSEDVATILSTIFNNN